MSQEQPGKLQEKITDYWNSRAATGGPWTLGVTNERERQVWLETLRGLLPPAPVDVLDVGTGQGFLAMLLADLGHRVTGIDLAEALLATARANSARLANPPVFQVGDAMAPPLPPSSVDVVANRQVVWTLLDPAKAFRNWWELLRPGGRILVLHAPTRPGPLSEIQLVERAVYTDAVMERLPGMRDRPTFEPLLPLVDEAGFVDVTVTRLHAIDHFEGVEREPPRDTIWQALTAVRPD